MIDRICNIFSLTPTEIFEKEKAQGSRISPEEVFGKNIEFSVGSFDVSASDLCIEIKKQINENHKLNGLNRKARRSKNKERRDILSRIPIFPTSNDVEAQAALIIHDRMTRKISKKKYRESISQFIIEPKNFIRLAQRVPESLQIFALTLREPAREMFVKLADLNSEMPWPNQMNNSEFAEFCNRVLSRIRINLMKDFIGNPEDTSIGFFSDFATEYFREFLKRKWQGESSLNKASDAIDALHFCYLPYVDVFRTDTRMLEMTKKLTKNHRLHISSKPKQLLDLFEKIAAT